MEIFINSILSDITDEESFTKQIHMAMKQSCVRELHPELQIFPDYKWKDTTWMKQHVRNLMRIKSPMAIYEVHPGSWKKHAAKDEDDPGFYNYRELAHELAAVCEENGLYTCRTDGNCRASV